MLLNAVAAQEHNDGQFETEFYLRMRQAGRDRKISASHRKGYSCPMCENGLSQMM